MGRVSKPHVPEGPVLAFFERLHALHVAAGQPSMRTLQRRTRSMTRPNGIDPTTIHAAFTRPKPARREVVLEIVRALSGDTDEFAQLWHAARHAETRTTVAAGADESRPPLPVPQELPPDVFAFTGRTAALATIDELLASPVDQPTAVVIAMLAGTAGVGKTALAVHWAHHVADRFPDGHLYADLRGYDPDQPMTPAEVLARFLRAVGVAGADIPYDLAERAARYRSMLAGRRMLVILDNASTTEQVRPLLPGTPSCVVLVTSRDNLAGLVARHGARRLDLELFAHGESVRLLRTLLGARASADPAAVRALAEVCTGLPLALRIAAEVAIARPTTPLADLVAEFRDERHRLDLFDAGADERTGIRAVFSWSYRRLSAGSARMFRLFGIHPAPDVSVPAAAALAGVSWSEAGRTLDALTGAHLVHSSVAGRYAMHDLLRTYASRLAADEEKPDDQRAALTRLFDHYLTTAAHAMDSAFPAERDSRPHLDLTGHRTPALDDPAAARRWLDSERATLVTCTVHCAQHGWPTHAISLASTLWRYLQNGAHHGDAAAMHTAALDASRELGDRAGEGTALTNLGTVYWRWGRYERATDRYQQALVIFDEIGHRRGQARALTNLGAVHWRRGHYDQAAASCERAVAVFLATGDRQGEARALDNLGTAYQRQGRAELAADRHRRALALFREIGDRAGEARALDNLGIVHQRQGDHDQAAAHHRQALDILRQIGDRAGEAQALDNLGIVHQRQGDHDQAAAHHQRVLEIAVEIGSRSREASALNALGDTLRAMAQPHDAGARYRSALTIAQAIGDRYAEARALDGIAHTRYAIGDVDLARDHWRAALTIYTQIGVPEADELRSALAIRPA